MAINTEGTTPAVSRTLSDGTLIELLYDSADQTTAFAVRSPEGEISVQEAFDLPSGERLAPYSPHNNLIATGCVLLPSTVGEEVSKTELLEEIRIYLRRYVDLSNGFEDIAAHYALLSWVYDAFSEVPYLRFRGDYGTGKTRALQVLGSICYKPFFASGASTVSPIFHVLDAFQGTLVLDEADFRFTDATAALTKILNNGNAAGLPVLRTMTNRHKEFDPRAFRVFGPKLVGMRERFEDPALESRFLTEETGLRPLREGIPIQLPGSLAEDALVLRNKLLMWRFRERGRVAVNPGRLAAGLEPRLNQTALSLLSIVDDEAVVERIHAELRLEQARIRQERGGSLEAAMVEVVQDLLGRRSSQPTVAMIAAGFNDRAADRLSRPVSSKWVGSFLRTKLKLTTVKSNGVFVVPATEQSKIRALAARYGVDPTDVSPAPTTARHVALSTERPLVQSPKSGDDRNDPRGRYQPDLSTHEEHQLPAVTPARNGLFPRARQRTSSACKPVAPSQIMSTRADCPHLRQRSRSSSYSGNPFEVSFRQRSLRSRTASCAAPWRSKKRTGTAPTPRPRRFGNSSAK